LTKKVVKQLAGNFDGEIPWYVITVKLDLEARGILKQIPKKSPQRITLVKQKIL